MRDAQVDCPGLPRNSQPWSTGGQEPVNINLNRIPATLEKTHYSYTLWFSPQSFSFVSVPRGRQVKGCDLSFTGRASVKARVCALNSGQDTHAQARPHEAQGCEEDTGMDSAPGPAGITVDGWGLCVYVWASL